MTEQVRQTDRLATLGKLACEVVHEIGTPLNVISARAQMLLDDPSGAGVAENARAILAQVERTSARLRRLLAYGSLRTRHEVFDLQIVASSALALLAPLLEKRGVQLIVPEPHAPALVDGDPGQFEQALVNLIVNACQAMPGGGEMRVALTRERARAPDSDGAAIRAWHLLEICDQGVGMAPDVLARVFEPFFTTKDADGGTGLGLSVVLDIVREHGGWIDVASEPDRGSRFAVHVPAWGGP